MGERITPDRKAEPGKFCVWVETIHDGDQRLPIDFSAEGEAKQAAFDIGKQDEMKTIDAVIVYDDAGWFKYKLEKR